MSKPRTNIVNVDLDQEPLVYQGKEYDEAGAERLAQEIVAKFRAVAVGRPSLTGKAGRTPAIGVRVTPEQRVRLQERAERENKRISDVVRDAIEHYV